MHKASVEEGNHQTQALIKFIHSVWRFI